MSNIRDGIVSFKKIPATDGILVVGETGQEIPFYIKRVFWIHHTPEGISRAKHACRNAEFVVLCVQGKITVILDDGSRKQTYYLEDDSEVIYIPRMTWMETCDFTEDAIMLVLASEKYYADQYVDDYDEFLQLKKSEK